MFYLYVNKYLDFFFPLPAANVAYFQRKIQLSGHSVYPDISPSELIRVIGVLLYFVNRIFHFIVSVRSYSQTRRSDLGNKFPYDIP